VGRGHGCTVGSTVRRRAYPPLWVFFAAAVSGLWGFLPAVSVRPRAKALPLEKRGPKAWVNAAQEYTEGRNPNRPHIHSVDDGTGVSYLKEVFRFLRNVKVNQIPFSSPSLIDRSLANELADRCYLNDEPLYRGANLFFGFLYAFPDFHDQLPLSWRAFRTWQRTYPSGEGYAFPEEAIFCILERFCRAGQLLEMVWTWLSFHCYLRQQDAEMLMTQDANDDGNNIAFMIAPRERGKRAKTGSDQGVLVECPALVAVLRALLATLRPGIPLFPFDRSWMARAWASVLIMLALPLRALHVLRHSGATADAATKRRDMEEIRRRGRWSQPKSVARYAKPYMLVRARSETPDEVLEQGAEISRNLPGSLSRAIREGAAGDTVLGKAFADALDRVAKARR
jgi:hypothetical protein